MDAYRIEDCIAQASLGMSLGNHLRGELFETGTRAKPGRFDAWLDKFWVPLFSASARPTTAAL